MKARLVESHRERLARIEAGELKVIGQNCFTETEDSPLDRRRGRRHPHPRPRGRARADRGARGVEGGARRRRRSRRRSTALAEAAADESVNLMPATIEAAKAGATTGEWAETLREVFGAYRGPTGVDGSATGGNAELLAEVREQRRRGQRVDRPPDPDPRRQARPRRPLQRRRADRRPRPRRRHGGHLPGHPPDPRGDRRLRRPGGRRRGRPLDPLRLPPRARPARRRADPRGGRRRAGDRRRDHPAGRRPQARRGRRRPRLHAQGLRPEPDHGRHRRARRRAHRSLPARLQPEWRRSRSRSAGSTTASSASGFMPTPTSIGSPPHRAIPRFNAGPGSPTTTTLTRCASGSAGGARDRARSSTLVIVDADADEPLGCDRDRSTSTREECRCEIGYWLAAEARGRGVATRAVRLLSAWIFAGLPVDRIAIPVMSRQPRLPAVAERAGFTFEGVLRSWLVARGRAPRRGDVLRCFATSCRKCS